MKEREFMKWCLAEAAKDYKATNITTFKARNQIKRFQSGIYLLWNKKTKRLEYVGQSKNIRGRLNPEQHIYNPKKHIIGVIRIDETRLRCDTEQLLIYCFEPQENNQIPVHIWQGADIERMIERMRIQAAYQLPLV